MRSLGPWLAAAAPRTRALAVLAGSAALLVALLAGCADAGQVSAGGGQPSEGATTASSATTAPSTVLPTAGLSTTAPSPVPPAGSQPPPVPGQPGEVTVTGAVQEGVEGGCLLLVTQDGTQYLLLGGDRQVLRSGATVVVKGRPQPGMLTTCQQGTPFAVSSARPG